MKQFDAGGHRFQCCGGLVGVAVELAESGEILCGEEREF